MPAKTGRKVANLKFASTDDQLVSMNDFQGRWLVLYFYPKDSTSGCTREAEDFTQALSKLKTLKATVVGVSRDSIKSHHKFIEKIGIVFPLISDPDEKLCDYFGVMKQKSMYGRTYMGIERSTFVIDPEGKLRHEVRGVKVPGHVEAIVSWLSEVE